MDGHPHMSAHAAFGLERWSAVVSQHAVYSPVWLPCWPALTDQSRSSKSVEAGRIWEIYDGRLQFIAGQDVVAINTA